MWTLRAPSPGAPTRKDDNVVEGAGASASRARVRGTAAGWGARSTWADCTLQHAACSSLRRRPRLGSLRTRSGSHAAAATPVFPSTHAGRRARPRGVSSVEATNGTYASADASRAASSGGAAKKAAFFDIDGTILKSNVVWPFVLQRLRELPLVLRLLWFPYYALKAIMYKALDRINRSLFNVVFYRDYAGRDAGVRATESMGSYVMEHYFRPRLRPAAAETVEELKAKGYLIVLVTGTLDFLAKPIQQMLGAHCLLATQLETRDGRFTGRIQGKPLANKEKEVQMRAMAEEHGIDLSASLGYGDSIGDLDMLECVGNPFAVRPDSQLAAVAQARGWPRLDWADPTSAEQLNLGRLVLQGAA